MSRFWVFADLQIFTNHMMNQLMSCPNAATMVPGACRLFLVRAESRLAKCLRFHVKTVLL